MAKSTSYTDFRTTRALLPDDVFLLATGERPGPTDLVAEDVWHGIMHLADDVAITTSDHHGSQLRDLYSLWGDWLDAMGHDHDELFIGMLDAADCFQASTFDMLHGYYRSAVSNLRSAIELVAIGSLGNLFPSDIDYQRWKKQNLGSQPFPSCIRKLRGGSKAPIPHQFSSKMAVSWPFMTTSALTHTHGLTLAMARCGEATARFTSLPLWTSYSSCRRQRTLRVTSSRRSAGHAFPHVARGSVPSHSPAGQLRSSRGGLISNPSC